jgi:hypothetical protein
MKTLIGLITMLTATSAHAANTNQVFMSNTLIFAFLGFCALVVVIQLIPAIITLHAMIKAALSAKQINAYATKKN